MAEKYLNGTNNFIMSFHEESRILQNTFVQAGLILLYSIIFVTCFFGNLVVILVVKSEWKIRSVSMFCLGNMAVANFSVSLFCILQNLTLYMVDAWIFGELVCKMFHFITNMCHTASILMVVLISVERYVVLLHSLRCRRLITTLTLEVIILAMWTLSAAISLPHFFYSGLIRIQLNESGDFGDSCEPVDPMYNSATADTIYFLLLYLIPLALMSALYLRLGQFLRQRESLRSELEEDTTNIQNGCLASHLVHSSQKQCNDQNFVGNRPIVREVQSVPADLGSISVSSDGSSSRGVLTSVGQILLQQEENTKYLNMNKLYKWRNNPSHVLQLESTEEFAVCSDDQIKHCSAEIETRGSETVGRTPEVPEKVLLAVRNRSYEIRRNGSGGGLIGDTRTVCSTTKSLASLPKKERRRAMVINPEAQKSLYFYKRRHLSHIRCKQRQRVVRTFVLSVISFAVLNLPYHLRKLCLHYLPSYNTGSDFSSLTAPLTLALMYANCAVNPILYAFMSKNFRANLREFCFGDRRNIVHV